MRWTRFTAALSAAALAAALPIAAAAPAAAVPAQEALAAGAVGGYSAGSVLALEAVTGDPGTVANSVAQSAADAAVGRELVDSDVLGNAVLFATAEQQAGKNAYGHGSSVNVGVGQAADAVPQVAPAVAEALSPPPTVAEPGGGALPAELAPVVQAEVLPSTAQARTTSLDSICPDGDGDLISEGTAQAANAQLLPVLPAAEPTGDDGSLIATGGVVSSVSQTVLEGTSLVSVTTQSIAPVTLFEGTAAQLRIEVVHQLQLRATATGGAGSELFYGFVDSETGERVPDSEPVVFVNGMGLTTEQVLGADGLQLGLGVADVIIGGPAHGLDDDPTSDPTVSPTIVAGASDLIRVTVPGDLPVPSTDPIAEDSPLAGLNEVLNPILEGLAPLTEQIQAGLDDAGVSVVDLRVGHLEALAVVPVGGVVCAATPDEDPLAEARKDASTRSVAPGGTFDYTIRFPNRGTEDLTDVTVVDTFSEGLELVTAEGTVTPPEGEVREVAAPTQDGNVLTFDVGTVEPNAFVLLTITFRVREDVADGTVFRNTATISATFRGELITRDVVAEGPTVTDSVTGACDVSRSTKFASNLQVRTGDQFAYVVNVSNTGAEPCTDVTVTDQLVDGVEFVSCSDDCTVQGREVTFDLGTLAGGSTTTVSFVVRVTATSGTLPNTALVETGEGSTAQPSTPGPTVSDVSVVAPGAPAGCPATGCPGAATAPDRAAPAAPVAAAPVQGRRLAATGLTGAAPALLVLGLAGGLAVWRRRLLP